ncbi:HAMP domain-containing protein, partial [Burkholderia sp. SIMBA_024]|uniref:HAMP domain-containing protein n=1 Tax=Burkholderia sp. SIMBA_024 TaxID=3085768 RepID=UPI00397BE0BC
DDDFEVALWASLGIGLLVLYGLLGGWVHWRLTRPLERMHEMMRRVGEGDLDARVDVGQRDEVGELADGLNDSVDRIRRLID